MLGKSPSWQDAGGACSGYLVEGDGARLLLDCGSGVFGKLRAAADYAAVDAVVVSHLHADHVLDLIPFAAALTYGPRAGSARPRLILPAGGTQAVRRLAAAAGMGEGHVAGAFALEEYAAGADVAVGGLRLRFQPVPHFVPTCAVDVAEGAGRITYGADTSPSDDLVAFAAGTDVLLIEATLTAPERSGPRGHLTPVEAGEHGRRAGAGRLVLTHLSDELDAGHARAEAERAFGGPVEVAREGAVYRV